MKPIDSLSDDEWQALVQRAIAMADAPPQLVQDALELWRMHRPPQRAQPMLQRWVAVLSFDSWAGAPVVAGMRALPSEVRQMLFAAEGREIDLRIAPVAEGFALSGQLLGPGAEGSVELTAVDRIGEGPLQRSVALDALSEFRIDGVRSGTYRITVRLGSDEIVLPTIGVGPPRDAGGP